MRRSSTAARLCLIGCAALLLVAASAALGPNRLTWDEVLNPSASRMFWPYRLPRTLLAATAGAGLALGGVVFQSLFRNPLATPYTLGIASGASLAAALTILTGWGAGRVLGVPSVPLAAFGGSIAALGMVFLVARTRGGRDMARLLLAGVCMSYMTAAGIMLAHTLAERSVSSDILIWTMGTLARFKRSGALEVLVGLLPALAFTLVSHRALDLIAMGEAVAAGRGVAVERTVWLGFVLIGVLTAVIVANCGPIGFVGLMVPHMARALVGPRIMPLTISSIAIGAGFLALCDGLARMLLFEIPVGVITNTLGAAFFFYILATRDPSVRLADRRAAV